MAVGLIADESDSWKGDRSRALAITRALACLTMLFGSVAAADDEPNGALVAIQTTTRPLPKRNMIRLQPSYTFLADGGGELGLEGRGLLVYRGLLIPGLGPSDAASGLRVTVSLERMKTPTETTTGLSDTELVYISGAQFDWGAVGGGVALMVPTATSSSLGTGQVALGPAAFVLVSSIPHVDLSVLARSFFTVGGDSARATVLVTRVEPNVTFELPDDLLIDVKPNVERDWHAETTSVPIEIMAGYVFDRHFVLKAGPVVTVAGPDRGELRLQLQLSYVDP